MSSEWRGGVGWGGIAQTYKKQKQSLITVQHLHNMKHLRSLGVYRLPLQEKSRSPFQFTGLGKKGAPGAQPLGRGAATLEIPQISLIQGEQERRTGGSRYPEGGHLPRRVSRQRGGLPQTGAASQRGGSGCCSPALPALLCGRL